VKLGGPDATDTALRSAWKTAPLSLVYKKQPLAESIDQVVESLP
jgi:hypothetical protein